MTIQGWSPGNTILAFTQANNTIMGECCCVAAPTPTTPDCPTCPNGWPSMLVSVVGASGTINWCNETWNLPADSGTEYCVCPTDYIFTQGVAGGNSYYAQHRWRYNFDLRMERRYNATVSGTQWFAYWYTNFNNLTLFGTVTPTGQRDSIQFYKNGAGRPNTAGWSLSSIYYSTLGKVTGLGVSYSDFSLIGAFFGSHTVGGITYTWKKANDWP